MRHAAQQVRERGEKSRALRLDMIQRLERLPARRELAFGGAVDAQPGANRLQDHIQETIARRKGSPMKLLTYLNYGGNCRQAFEFYEKHFGGTISMLTTHGEQPDASK